MRHLAVLLAVVVAGCVSGSDGEEDDAAGNGTTPSATPTLAPDAQEGPMGERAPATMERFMLMPDGAMRVHNASEPEAAVTLVPEPLRPTAFYESFATPLELQTWTSEPFRSAWETTGDIEIRLSFSASAPAASVNPRAAGFPPAGAFLGTPERFAFFLLSSDAPDTLEAGRVYTIALRATPPQGGFFVREGEQLALHTFLAYQPADGSKVSYVVGGPDPAGLVLPHEHFNLTAPTATTLLEEAGEIAPNPGPTGDMQETPVEIPFTVPPEALFVVMEVDGAPKAGSRLDLDVSARTAGGEVVSGSFGPGQKEMVVLGPGNLAAHGRSLAAFVTNAANPSGATFTLKVTAYSA